jgi:hypothetical protein
MLRCWWTERSRRSSKHEKQEDDGNHEAEAEDHDCHEEMMMRSRSSRRGMRNSGADGHDRYRQG